MFLTTLFLAAGTAAGSFTSADLGKTPFPMERVPNSNGDRPAPIPATAERWIMHRNEIQRQRDLLRIEISSCH